MIWVCTIMIRELLVYETTGIGSGTPPAPQHSMFPSFNQQLFQLSWCSLLCHAPSCHWRNDKHIKNQGAAWLRLQSIHLADQTSACLCLLSQGNSGLQDQELPSAPGCQREARRAASHTAGTFPCFAEGSGTFCHAFSQERAVWFEFWRARSHFLTG